MKRTILIISLILIYFAAGFLTYGFIKMRRGGDALESFFGGVGWPIYWTFRGLGCCATAAEDVFKTDPTPRHMKVENDSH
ncbi:MAG: hypothetical protein WC869_01195 [Phycisphaerae bacterium]